jgi:hypothetical protein
MQNLLRTGAAHFASVACCLLVVHVAACRDTATAANSRDDVRMTPQTSVSPTALQARQHIHARNAYDWAGNAHNKILDEWRRDMRKPGLLTQSLCGYVVDFVSRDDRLAPQNQVPLPIRRNAITAASKASQLCGDKVKSKSSQLASTGSLPQESGATTDLALQIESAIDESESSFDLATRLNAVLDAASALDETERAVVAATVSVAQSSFEYWETEFEPLVYEIGNEYGDCGTDRLSTGYSGDAARDSCLSGTYFETSYRRWSPSGMFGPTSARSRSSRLACGPTLREGFKNVAKGDAKGAFVGAWAGAFGAAAGVVGGAILGGASGSIWAAGENAWSTYWCIMQK